ncbi:hypothetical protein FXF51_54820 [Nonomuraea sp. PA05]|uniref:hypothetical protein n=1 Tax=Nonomuraea sp. PA05 TaxID=2604466 RepID=UPI0011D4C51D|nr:hypothetical protein [Nonomuraea sp. PA05]TYB50950.1 hypothetical protein FXF51_54820 [Nonomuraea sp. PA05]
MKVVSLTERAGSMRGNRLEGLIPAGFVFVIGLCAAVALAFPESTARVVVTTLGVGVFGAWAVRHLAALCAAAMAWCFTTGFLVNTAGELTFRREDLVRLGVFIVVAVAGCFCGQAFRALGYRRRLSEPIRAEHRQAAVLPGQAREDRQKHLV